jgi:hypothetical protein
MDANQTSDYNTAVGHQALSAVTNDGSTHNTALGYQSGLSISTGTHNTCIGSFAGNLMDAEIGNTFVGYYAGGEVNHGADDCVAIGHTAMGTAEATQDGTVAIGKAALKSLTGGVGNTAVGYGVGDSITTGGHNTLMGYLAGGALDGGASHTTAVGRSALASCNLGGDTNNTAVGSEAGAAVTTGGSNTLIGSSAGKVIDEGAGNICIGYAAGDALTTGDGNIVMGNGTAASAVGVDDEITIGAAASGQGTTYAVIGNGNLTRLYAGDDAGGTFYGAGQSWSDKRIKENVKDIGLGLDFVNKLEPIQYTKKQPKDYEDSLKSKIYPSGSKQIVRNIDDTELQMKRAGFIAQDVLEALKEIGFDENNGIVQIDEKTTQHSMDYASMVVPLVKAVQELSAKVKALEDAQ